MQSKHDIPGDHVHQVIIDPIAAGDATELQSLFVAPFTCKITGVTITPDAAATGDNTNTKNLNIHNRGQAGAGTTEIANLDLVTGVDLVARDEKTIGSGMSSAVASGDVIALQVEQVGTGVAIPRSIVKITYQGA